MFLVRRRSFLDASHGGPSGPGVEPGPGNGPTSTGAAGAGGGRGSKPPNNGTPQTPQQKKQQYLSNFYNSKTGKAVQFGSPLALLPGWNPQWGQNLSEWGIAIFGKLGGLFGSGAVSGTTQLTTLRETVTVGSKLELGTEAVLGGVEKAAWPAMAVATVVDVGAHLNCEPPEPSPDAWIQGAATP